MGAHWDCRDVLGVLITIMLRKLKSTDHTVNE